MIESGNEPVEVSTHISPEDWTEATLGGLVGSYQDRVRAMGAPPEDVVTQVERLGDGSVSVRVSWDRRGTAMDPMAGDGASGGLEPDGSKPGLIMYTEEDGETFIELQDEHALAPPDQVATARGGESTTPGQQRPGVPWPWFVVIGAGLFAAVGGIGWLRRKTKHVDGKS